MLVAAISKKAKHLLRQVSTSLAQATLTWLKNGAGITNTIGIAELAAIAANTNDHIHTAADHLTKVVPTPSN